MSGSFDARLLGPLSVRVDATELRIGGPRQRAVLALLLLAGDRVVAADQIMEQLWGDDAFSRSRTTLHVYISNLRQELRRHETSVTIESAGGGYRLSRGDHLTDLERLDCLVQRARKAMRAGDHLRALDDYEAADGLDGGGFLDDLAAFACFASHRRRVDHLRASGAEERLRAMCELGHHASVLPAAESILADNPLLEGVWCVLALSLYRLARQSEALRVLQRARGTLADEVGLEPGPELRALESLILNHHPQLTSAAAFPRLRWIDPAQGTARCLELGDGHQVRVGRSRDSHVSLAGDRLVSRSHCQLRRTEEGWEVWPDPLAVNGTLVNGRRIDGPEPIRHGDRVRAGATVLIFETGVPDEGLANYSSTTLLASAHSEVGYDRPSHETNPNNEFQP